jgi:hypothetical protein
MKTNNPFKKSLDGKTLRYALPLVVVIAVLLAFSSPAAADYSGDKPMTIYDHDTIHGGLVYETVTDGSTYTALYTTYYRLDPGFGQPSEFWNNLTQTIEITGIPEGATVKMARLYNYYTWSTSDRDEGKYPSYTYGVPAEADMWFTNATATEKKVCVHGYPDDQRYLISNPIDYENGVIQYWDTKSQNYASKSWDYPDGAFAWDVTDMVTSNGIYTTKITNNDSTPSGFRPKHAYPSPNRERFCTFGFSLLVVYEHPDSPVIGYGIAEGCDLLWNLFGVTNEDATASATFGGVSGGTDANLTTVVGYSDEGFKEENMIIFNDNEIGPSTAGGIEHIGVNYFNVTALLSLGENVVEFQARGDGESVWNAFLVVVGGEWELAIPANVTFDKKKLNLNSSGILKAFITLPDGYNVADINVSTVTCEGAPAFTGGGVIPGKEALEVKFKIPDLKEKGVEPGTDVKLTVKGVFMDGTLFVGSDTVGVIV